MTRKLSAIITLLVLGLMLGSCSLPATGPPPNPPEPPNISESQVDPQESWWLKPQGYTYGGDIGHMQDENCTVVWWGQGSTSPEKIRTKKESFMES